MGKGGEAENHQHGITVNPHLEVLAMSSQHSADPKKEKLNVNANSKGEV